MDVTASVRVIFRDAARAVVRSLRREQTRRESRSAAHNPVDRAQARRVLEEMDELRTW